MKHALKGFVLLLVALAIVRLAVMVVAPVFDPSEGRYAAICANMAESGDFLVPRFIHNRVFQSFDGKPPLLFQLGGAFCTVLGRREIAVRLPSFLAALGLLGLLFLVLRRLRDAAAARVAVLVCATAVASTATAIAAGDWSRRVEEEKKESREVRALVRAFNGMCDKNEKTLNELRVLTDNIAHDLRTPLTRLSMAAETVLTGGTLRDPLPDRVLGEARGMLEMINTMLEISQTGAKIDRSPRTDLDFAHLVRDLGDFYQPLAEQAGLTLRVHVPERGLAFSGHRAKLQQLVGNLLENAIKYTPRGGRIDLSLDTLPEGVRLVVVDTGCGISAADLPHIYTRFWRADASRSLPGNGLGLALVKAIVTSYGGRLHCDSVPGQGSAFTVVLPTDG